MANQFKTFTQISVWTRKYKGIKSWTPKTTKELNKLEHKGNKILKNGLFLQVSKLKKKYSWIVEGDEVVIDF